MAEDARIDAYIEAQQPFARLILSHLRALIHAVLPQVEETVKWGRPFFLVAGRPLCFLAAFKAHAAFGFWRAGSVCVTEAEGAGSFGRLASLADLPDDETLRTLILAAAAKGAAPRKTAPRAVPRPAPVIPADFATALTAAPTAATRFATLAPGQRREYVDWIAEAKRAETRARRIATSIERLSAGETLNQRHATR